MFLHCISHKRLENLVQHYNEIGLGTRTRGNVKCLPKNALSFEDTNRLTTFVTNYSVRSSSWSAFARSTAWSPR